MNKTIYTVAIVDDQLASTGVLRGMLERFPFLDIVYEEEDPFQAFEYLRKHMIDLLFIDMDMPGMDGETLVGSLELPPVVAICTSFGTYGYVVTNIGAKGYISKMPNFEHLKQLVWDMVDAVDRREDENRSAESITIMDQSEKEVVLQMVDIRYISSHDKVQTIVTPMGTFQVRMSLSSLLGMLPKEDFWQVHKSYVVALGAVVARTGINVMVKDSEINIPIGRKYKEEFQRAMATYKLKNAKR